MVLVFSLTEIYGQQQDNKKTNPDSLFTTARQYAEDGELTKCRELCFSVLNEYPLYFDYSILAGRTLAWENKFDSAKTIIEPILITEPYYKAALLALADIELWQKNYEEALAFVDTGLVQRPNDVQLLDKRAEILQKMASQDEDFGALYPDSNAIGLTYFFEFYKKPYIARRHMLSFQYMKITDFAPLIGRLNIGDNVLNNEYLFKNPSYQIEIDAYPGLDEKSYLYLNYGLGSSSFFPIHKAAVEYFQGLNNSFEVSAGSRYMYWDYSILFITGSISRYLRAYWLSFRPFFSITSNNFADAYLFEARRYFGIHNSYLYGIVIIGDSPDQPLSLAEEFGNFRSIKYVIGIKHRISQWQISSSFGFQREEYLKNKFRTRTEYRIGVNYVF